MSILSQLHALSDACEDEMYRECIEEMILKSAEYVEIVTRMETLRLNFPKRKGEHLRDAVSDADHRRHMVHDTLIVAVDVVNRICSRLGIEPVYTGSAARREYGDFAFQLVEEIYKIRS